MQVAIWKVSHINDPKPSAKNVWTKNHNEVLLPTNLSDILEHQNVDETNDEELDLNGDTGWDSDDYDKESACDVDSGYRFDDRIHYWLKIVANVFQENPNFVYDFALYSSFT